MKKTFMYNFIPSKEEEEACKASGTPWVVTRELVEIRDIYPAPVINPNNPWKIKKVITDFEESGKMLVLSFIDIFEHVFRYWTLDTVKSATSGHKMSVYLWDVTNENSPNKCEGSYIEMIDDENYALVSVELFSKCGLVVNDVIGLYWDPKCLNFRFKLFKKDCA
ncbi:putative ethylene-responsive transcription factor CRF4-like [Capsicum annuum]|uniref:Uncharacterized protein n=1 Tax=Capsicum annuum TaxID=4072 RepID=A0A2G2ZJV6_CAPAN|nr:putative ethylene-responsive transcription factor CRF4-like [Capsicum annuum]KAF3657141.1 putative ethylene-responsive transcription factor CRF4-like [Capsicum annuum]PHT82256.1 hypothetical protein T459_15271 [Capsicum annuum]